MKAPLPFDPKLIVTTESIPGYEVVSSLGVAEGYGLTLYPALTADGRRDRFNELLSEATLDMMNRASAQGAQALVGLRYVTLNDGGLMVYATAVTIRRISMDWNQPSIRV